MSDTAIEIYPVLITLHVDALHSENNFVETKLCILFQIKSLFINLDKELGIGICKKKRKENTLSPPINEHFYSKFKGIFNSIDNEFLMVFIK